MLELELKQVAISFRKALEIRSIQDHLNKLKSFPTGCCKEATLLLGTYYLEHHFVEFDYMVGDRGDPGKNEWGDHAWLERDKLIIDITADQFHDCKEKPGSVKRFFS